MRGETVLTLLPMGHPEVRSRGRASPTPQGPIMQFQQLKPQVSWRFCNSGFLVRDSLLVTGQESQ